MATENNRRKGRILILDDREDWLTLLRDLLQDASDDPRHPFEYKVDCVNTVEAAEALIKENPYHVWILDVNMVGDGEPNNSEGYEMLVRWSHEGWTKNVAVFMISGHARKELVRQTFKDQNVRDFIFKDDFSGTAFVDSIRAVFEENPRTDEVRINLDLQIIWKGELTTIDDAMDGLSVDGEWLRPIAKERIEKAEGERKAKLEQQYNLFEKMKVQFDDMLCRLFHRYHTIYVYSLGGGFSGASVLLVERFLADGTAARPVAAKVGDVPMIAEEYENYSKYVKDILRGAPDLRETMTRLPNLAGIVYNFVEGRGTDKVEDFASYFKSQSAKQLSAVVTQIFTHSCELWYDRIEPINGSLQLQYHKLTNMSQKALDDGIFQIRSEVDTAANFIIFKNLSENDRLPNPIPLAMEKLFHLPYKACPTHGDLNHQNVLVDQDDNPWLIDFRHTGKAHAMRDFAKLETTICTQLLSEDVTLAARRELCEHLFSINDFSEHQKWPEHLPSARAEVNKVYQLVRTIRQLALNYSPRRDTMDDYYVALFYFYLNTIRYYRIPKLDRTHALLGACLLIDKVKDL